METGGADGAGLEEVHGRASPSNHFRWRRWLMMLSLLGRKEAAG